jgi:hypothetical protein
LLGRWISWSSSETLQPARMYARTQVTRSSGLGFGEMGRFMYAMYALYVMDGCTTVSEKGKGR